MSNNPTSRIVYYAFVVCSLMSGFVITRLSMLAGGAYAITVEPDFAKLTAEVVAAANLVTYVFYQIIVGGLVLYTAWKMRISWGLHIFLFAGMPIAVFLFRGSIPPRLRLFFLVIIASLAVYQVLVAGYRYHRTKTEG